MQRNRQSVSDRLDCPQCDGTGEDTLGPLTVMCTFCRGYGYVGDDNEPAERDEPDGDFDPYEQPQGLAGNEPGAGLPGCPACLGTGKVVSVGDVRRPSTLVETPCPMCG
jgi:DnaJ-class molecular chaperone